MKVRLFSLTATMEQLQVPLEERPVVLSIALARAFGYKLPIPAAAVADPRMHYEENLRTGVEQTLASINERMTLDFTEVSALVAAIWMFRYRMVYDPSNPAVREFLDNMVKVGSREFPIQVSEYLIRAGDNKLVDKVATAIDDTLAPAEEIQNG